MKSVSLHLIPKPSKKAKKYEPLSKREYLAQQTPPPKINKQEIQKKKAEERKLKKEAQDKLKQQRIAEHKQRMKEWRLNREKHRAIFEEQQIKKALQKEYVKEQNVGKTKMEIMRDNLAMLQAMPEEEKLPKHIRKERRLTNYINRIQVDIEVEKYILEMCKAQAEIEKPKVVKRWIRFSNHALARYNERVAPLGISLTQVRDDITKNRRSIKASFDEFEVGWRLAKYILAKDRKTHDFIIITIYVSEFQEKRIREWFLPGKILRWRNY